MKPEVKMCSKTTSIEEDERHLMRLLYANVPSAKAFCSTIAPACYEDYEAKGNRGRIKIDVVPNHLCWMRHELVVVQYYKRST